MDPIKTADELQQLLNQAEADKAELQKKLEEVLEANDALTEEIEKFTKTAASNKPEEKPINLADHRFEYEGVKYGFNYPKMVHNRQVITPVEIKASKELQADLINRNSSMIKLL